MHTEGQTLLDRIRSLENQVEELQYLARSLQGRITAMESENLQLHGRVYYLEQQQPAVKEDEAPAESRIRDSDGVRFSGMPAVEPITDDTVTEDKD